MKKDRELQELFRSGKVHFSDSEEFISRLESRMGYCHHYDILLERLEQERRSRRRLAVALAASSAALTAATAAVIFLSADITAGLPDILREAAEKVRDFTGNGNGQRTLLAVGAAISFTCMVLGIRLSSPSSVR